MRRIWNAGKGQLQTISKRAIVSTFHYIRQPCHIRNNNTIHIIKMREYMHSRQMSFDEVKVRLESQLRMLAQEKRMNEWRKELRIGAKIERIEMDRHNGIEENRITLQRE